MGTHLLISPLDDFPNLPFRRPDYGQAYDKVWHVPPHIPENGSAHRMVVSTVQEFSQKFTTVAIESHSARGEQQRRASRFRSPAPDGIG